MDRWWGLGFRFSNGGLRSGVLFLRCEYNWHFVATPVVARDVPVEPPSAGLPHCHCLQQGGYCPTSSTVSTLFIRVVQFEITES